MWSSLWRPINRFSLQYFRYTINELQEIKVVDEYNREIVIDLLQSIVEIVTYGDRQDPLIFECFMEYQVLAQFVRILKISQNSRIEAPLLQYLSIMIQNMSSEHAIYYCFSNDYINNIIEHEYEFDEGDLALYYVSFLRAVSSKMNREILCLLVKVHGNVVISFPLYTASLKFACHGEKMIQTAIRALTLNIYNVSDDMVYKFVTTPPSSKYFSDLVHSLKDHCIHLDELVHATEEACTDERIKQLLVETDKIVDDLYYFKDVVSISETWLSGLVTQNLLNLLVFPILLSLLLLRQSNGSSLSSITSFYILNRLLQVIDCKSLINSVAGAILYPYMKLSLGDATEGEKADSTTNVSNFLPNCLNDIKELVSNGSEFAETEKIDADHLFGRIDEYLSSNSHFKNCHKENDIHKERRGILAFLSSDNHCVQLASLLLLLILAESKDLDYKLASLIGFGGLQHKMEMHGSVLTKLMPEALNAVLNILASDPATPVLVKWHAGWFLQKLVNFHGMRLCDENLHLFNDSYEQSLQRLQNELDGCWFDHILITLKNEWTSCGTALEEPSQSKDPLFVLEVAVCQQTTNGIAAHYGGDKTSSYAAWRRMVDVVKVFVLHLQLKALIFEEELLEKHLLVSMSSSTANSGRTHVSEASCASFGSDISLGAGIPCQIAFSNAGLRDIFMIPVARQTSGKLLLAEKHPIRGQRGVVIAAAPLARLSPKIDEGHPTWLHLRIREFDTMFDASNKGFCSKMSNDTSDGRWTLGFSTAKACEAAQLLILRETSKQRSATARMLAPLLNSSHTKDL
ncbi:protein TRANSPARENT TESTA 9-like isoform X2 [Tripterygium wilfordii]|uniref:protein TRANSPARENT TESTA 9-like isoform X2 n=1 Tax=Tripterygium wilfordii TaxID=458696 RepID=UPI0018F84062|nr:protein TRANSPARENT TESTA 9-like isoform X2 [Tripterygium wilfordii]